jgi:hypothetical protein
MLLRLVYLSMANAVALLRLLPMSHRDKDMTERRLDRRPHQLENTALPTSTKNGHPQHATRTTSRTEALDDPAAPDDTDEPSSP